MSGLGPVVALLWKELGLAPPVDPVGAAFEFELGEMPLRLDLQDNGDTVVLRGRIGFLEGNAHEAGDQLARVFRLGLGLTALNAAALDAAEAEALLEAGHEGPVPVHAVALAQLSRPATVIPALRAVLDWQSVTDSILSQSADTDGPGPGARPDARSDTWAPGAEMIIFQP